MHTATNLLCSAIASVVGHFINYTAYKMRPYCYVVLLGPREIALFLTHT